MLSSVCLLDDLVLGFCDSSLTQETGRFELTSASTLVILQVNRLSKRASHFLVPHSISNKKEKMNINCVQFSTCHFCGFKPFLGKTGYGFGYSRSVASNLIFDNL